MKGFLEYSEGDSFLHRLSPLTKLIFSVALCAVSISSRSILFLLAVIGFNLLIGAAAGIFKTAAGILKGLVKLSIVLFLLQVFFIKDGTKLLPDSFIINITDKGLIFSSLIVLRLMAATMPLALMLSITKTNDLMNVLVKKLRVPYKYAFSLMTAVRFIPVFSSEMAGIIEAQTARGVEFDTKNVFKKVGLILPLCMPLLITSVRKIEGSAVSAELRGFEYRTRESGFKEYNLTLADISVIIFSVLLTAAAVITRIV